MGLQASVFPDLPGSGHKQKGLILIPLSIVNKALPEPYTTMSLERLVAGYSAVMVNPKSHTVIPWTVDKKPLLVIPRTF